MLLKILIITAIIKFNLFDLTECRRVKRVIAGKEVACGTRIGIGSLRNQNSESFCVATIWTRNAAITAAHCTTRPTSFTIQLNNKCNSDNSSPLRIQVSEVIRHPLYNQMTRAHDIAVLRLEPDLGNTTWLDDIQLSTSSFGLSGKCTIFGYGYTDLNIKKTSETLQAANVNIISLDECTNLLGQYVAPEYDSEMICAVGDGVDACQGDSGAPLICSGKLEGITSYGVSCGIPGIPGVYTSIGSNFEWIQGVLEGMR